MQLKHFDFTKKGDIRAAIDLLNHLIAECMVSEGYVRAFMVLDDWVEMGDEKQIENKASDLLHRREKAIEHWLSMYFFLHKGIEEVSPSADTKRLFDIHYELFDINKQKLRKFLDKREKMEPRIVNPSLRKQTYGLPHYFNKKDRADALEMARYHKEKHERKPLKCILEDDPNLKETAHKIMDKYEPVFKKLSKT